MRKIRLGVLGSTRGTDLEAVIQEVEGGKLEADIAVVISDRKDAYILERARSHGIEALFINPRDFSTREDFDLNIIEELERRKVNLVLLIGYMRILSPPFVRKYRYRIMNIHPSLLPAFSGGMDLNVHEAILEAGVKITGCTLHFVDEGTDTGPIILQKAVEVEEEDTPDTLKAKVQRAEQEVILKGVRLFQEGRLKVEGKRVKILGRKDG